MSFNHLFASGAMGTTGLLALYFLNLFLAVMVLLSSLAKRFYREPSFVSEEQTNYYSMPKGMKEVPH